MPVDRAILLHCHIFKNGGSTIDSILKNNFRTDSVNIESPHGTFIPSKKICEMVAKTPSLKSISSHKLRVCPPEHHEITFIPLVIIREPLDRLKSIYLFYKRQEQPISHECLLAQRTTFKEFVSILIEANLANSFTNLQSRFFLSHTIEPSQNNWSNIIKEASQNTCLGVLDLFEESLDTWKNYITKYFPKFDFTYSRQNISPNRSSSLNERLKEIRKDIGKQLVNKFLERNVYDYMLYKYTKTRLTRHKDKTMPNHPAPQTIVRKGNKKKTTILNKHKITIFTSRLLDTTTSDTIKIVQPGQKVTLETSIITESIIDMPIIGFTVKNNKKEIVFEGNNLQAQITLLPTMANSTNLYKFIFAMPPLNHGIYSITLAFASGTQDNHVLHCQQIDAIIFLIPATTYISLQGVIALHNINISCSTEISE